MSLRKRNGIWYVDITGPNGQRTRQSTATTDRRLAQQYHDRLKVALWTQEKLDGKPKHTWDEAALRWLEEQAHKAGIRKDAAHIKFFTAHFRGLTLEEITRDRIAELVDALKVTAATKNRYVAVIRAILRRAEREWEWLERAPALKCYREPKRRIRTLTPQEVDRLLEAMPEWLRECAIFALATGLRRGNIFGLRWDQIDLVRREGWVHPDQAKARQAIGVPLNEDAMAVLERQLGKHGQFVFTQDGEPITQIASKLWKRVLERAGLSKLRFHDLRHVWATRHVQAGTPMFALQELGGWESPAMVRRYAHLAPAHLAQHADRVTFAAQGHAST
jgi:integrase